MDAFALVLALAPPDKKDVDVSAHIDVATQSLWLASALIVFFFILRPELWRRIWFARLDPRPAALARMGLGITVLWTFADLAFLQGEWLFTDQGLFLTEQARKNYGGKFRTLWDPEMGFEHWWDPLMVMTDKWTLLHIRSDPPFVWTMFGILFASSIAMIVGWRTRITTVITWFMVLQMYGYSPIYFAGGDTVLRVLMFIGMFTDWGQAYSVDAWRRRRKAILEKGAKHIPGLKRIPAWPQRLFMLQLACIYSATGLLKSGDTWADGSALYYALNLDHFYRFPAHLVVAWAHELYITRVLSILVHWWEILFPIAIIGEALRGRDHDVDNRVWTGVVPRWTFYALVVAMAGLMTWTAPMWAKTLPLFVLAGILFVDRRWLKPASEKGRGFVALIIKLMSWGCILGVIAVLGYIAGLGVLYYYTPSKEAPAFWADKQQLQLLATVGTIAIPLTVFAIVAASRRWLPRIYLFIRDFMLGKRFWLVVGFGMHAGIEVSMNVGTFVQVMIAVYPIWLWGKDIDAMWRFLLWRPAHPGEAGRPPLHAKKYRRVLAKFGAPWQRMRHRVRPKPWVVVHGPAEMAIRRAALIRLWDVGQRFEFELDPARAGEGITLRDQQDKVHQGPRIGRALISLLPGLWLLWPVKWVPGIDRLAVAILRQRAA